MEVYRAPDIKYEFSISIDVDNSNFYYQVGDSVPMTTVDEAQAIFSMAVQSHEHVEINVLSPIDGKFVSKNRFEGVVTIADDDPDDLNYDPDTVRVAPISMVCIRQRQNTVMESH